MAKNEVLSYVMSGVSETKEKPLKVTVYLRGCLSRKKIFAHYLKRNHHKLYISTKLMKCTIR